MQIATITEAKNSLSALIDRVQAGETILIVERGRPVARLESAVSGLHAEGRLARLERAGLVRVATSRPKVKSQVGKRLKLRPGASGVRTLLDERDKGR